MVILVDFGWTSWEKPPYISFKWVEGIVMYFCFKSIKLTNYFYKFHEFLVDCIDGMDITRGEPSVYEILIFYPSFDSSFRF